MAGMYRRVRCANWTISRASLSRQPGFTIWYSNLDQGRKNLSQQAASKRKLMSSYQTLVIGLLQNRGSASKHGRPPAPRTSLIHDLDNVLKTPETVASQCRWPIRPAKQDAPRMNPGKIACFRYGPCTGVTLHGLTVVAEGGPLFSVVHEFVCVRVRRVWIVADAIVLPCQRCSVGDGLVRPCCCFSLPFYYSFFSRLSI
ncbi:hypothetical protein F4860DRAFT_378202 [Xylaria cubensis]|nr:hypothetical protein F4860DRAFT_378202 [Xylaria cubensis]